MTHIFSPDPIKLKIIDPKNKQTGDKLLIFVGSVPDEVKSELIKLQRDPTRAAKHVAKFYGARWREKLGIAREKLGIAREKLGRSEKLGGIEMDLDVGNELISLDDIRDIDRLRNVDHLFEDAAANAKQPSEQTGEQTKSAPECKNDIQFIFDVCLYPGDNILEFKEKIFLTTGIPIYRQHIWFKKTATYSQPVSYSMYMLNNLVKIDMESLVQTFYAKTDKLKTEPASARDEILGIPIAMEYYNNKDYITIIAQDTFNLLQTYYDTYNTTEYYLVDLNTILNPGAIYNALHNDRYQLDLIYYGFVAIYFPIITYNVFYDYLKNERDIGISYPLLRQDKISLRTKLSYEKKITDESYAARADKSVQREMRKKLFSSITGTMININNYKQDVEVLFSLRDVFDAIELSEFVPYCKVNLLHENRNIIIKKSYMNSVEPKESNPIDSLMVSIKINPDIRETLKLTIYKNGNYTVRTEWREEQHMNFTKIINSIAPRVNKIIAHINRLGTRIKYYPLHIPELTHANVNFSETNISFYYDDDITEAKFNVLKAILADYVKAGIILNKETLTPGIVAHEYFFRKGMYKYDPSRLSKMIVVNDYYAFLSNGIVRQKWISFFENTNLMQVLNVSSKIKIYISGIRNDTEMEYFYLYLTGLLSIYTANTSRMKDDLRASDHVNAAYSRSKKLLKSLKMQDPLLYNISKIYKSKVMYSKLCQKPYQPVILSDADYVKLASDKKRAALRYWNFTKQTPVWYSCPNPKYPFIKFIVKQHPKNFCIPCCKKISIEENNNPRKQDIYRTCMADHVYDKEKTSATKSSHYIASYGKIIEPGRISRLPEHTLEPLFFDTYSPEHGLDQECVKTDGYYLIGVDQNLPAISRVGYLFCLLHSLNYSLEKFLIETVVRLKKNPENFRVLLSGEIRNYFENIDDLCDAITRLGSNAFAPVDSDVWNALFMTIGYYYYGVNTILFEDKNHEMINMILPKGLKTVEEMFPPSHKNLITLRNRTNYYPIYLLNTEIYRRTGIIDTRLFPNESGLTTIVKSIVRQHLSSDNFERIKHVINLTIIKNYVLHAKKNIESYFINYSNMCYAVMISGVYIPIYPSYYSYDARIELIFAPYNPLSHECNLKSLLEILDSYNRYVIHVSKQEGFGGNVHVYPFMKVERWVLFEKHVSCMISQNMNFYFKSITAQEATRIKKVPVQKILYNPIEINRIIYQLKITPKPGKSKQSKPGKSKQTKPGKQDAQTTQTTRDASLSSELSTCLYDHYIYKLLILQFIVIFNSQRNIAVRKRISAIVSRSDFDKNPGKLKEIFDEISFEDITKLKNIVSKHISQQSKKKDFLSDIHASSFEFDRLALEKLKNMDYDNILSELHAISKKIVKYGDIKKVKNFVFPNILSSCDKQTDKNSYCSGGKFIIEKKRLDEMLQILAHDIRNPNKQKWLFNPIFIGKTINFFKFIKRHGENIFIEFI